MVAPNAVLTLDKSGTTIPPHNYDHTLVNPAKVVYMDPAGSDANNGLTPGAAVVSLSRVMQLTADDGTWTVVMRGGEHRTGMPTVTGNKPGTFSDHVTFQAYDDEDPWFNGCDIVTGWVAGSFANTWVKTNWDTPQFCGGSYYSVNPANQGTNGPCAFVSNLNDALYVYGADPQMVFIDGAHQTQVTTESAVVAGTFYYDWVGRRVVIGTNPSGKTVEVTVRPSLVFGGDAASGRDWAFKGIGFHRFASNEYNGASTTPEAATTKAAIYVGGMAGGQSVEFENCTFSWNAAFGVAISNPGPGSRIQSCILAHNGASGGTINGSQSTDMFDSDRFLFDNNMVYRNNREYFSGSRPNPTGGTLGCSFACAAAGFNIANLGGSIISNNVFDNNLGWAQGLWYDIANRNSDIIYNVFSNNGNRGLFYEISDLAIVACNLFLNNGGPAICIASANTDIWNNTVIVPATGGETGDQVGLAMYDDNRNPGWFTGSALGPNTQHNEFVNNVEYSLGPHWLNGATMKAKSSQDPCADCNTHPEVYFDEFGDNAYRVSAAGKPILIWGDEPNGLTTYASTGTIQSALGWEFGTTVASSGDPFFTDFAGGDYSIRDDSTAATGRVLPAHVATALGLATGAQVGKGAFGYPGHDAPVPPELPTQWNLVNGAGSPREVLYVGYVTTTQAGEPTIDTRPITWDKTYTGWDETHGGRPWTDYTSLGTADGGVPSTNFAGAVLDGGAPDEFP